MSNISNLTNSYFFNPLKNNRRFIIKSNSSSIEKSTSSEETFSDVSLLSRENKRKNYYEKTCVESRDDYQSRLDVVGLLPSEEENENIISMDEEIEKILIDIYNKNISVISSGEKKKPKKTKEINEFSKQIKSYL